MKQTRESHAASQRKYAEKQPPEWRVWKAVRARCEVPSHAMFAWYGGRGIKVCDRWKGKGGFKNFLSDMSRGCVNMSLDRIDPDKDYYKDNCRWMDKGENSSRSRGCFVSHGVNNKEVPF